MANFQRLAQISAKVFNSLEGFEVVTLAIYDRHYSAKARTIILLKQQYREDAKNRKNGGKSPIPSSSKGPTA